MKMGVQQNIHREVLSNAKMRIVAYIVLSAISAKAGRSTRERLGTRSVDSIRLSSQFNPPLLYLGSSASTDGT